ncbi:hypothetical protein POF50_016405 [Streptomyces sp. SL13]|jgi:hypothetical protein|uniref:Uncharacterized protein n=1 Tax=Streptantibioticus silvisoli TaxID=2705255 RepID=A0AA90KH24_9ACTN|nr:hypothetical protein [Streptantibioticus silvisoli]MDI5964591.1 hypothetical protein [Streptantibioticus silvisoli]MDI5970904.1 hypothetical protein [Streptantibioticus silvisoli]
MHVSEDELTSTLSEQLADGPLTSAVYARINASEGIARMMAPLGNLLIARPAATAKAHKITEETHVPMAAGMVLGLTATALHIWSADAALGHVNDHLGSVPREQISSLEAGTGGGWEPLTIRLADGHKIDIQARGTVQDFVKSFG